MGHSRLHRPRVSRETRLLLNTAFVAIMALWILARIRFPDRPATTPVQPLLTQLGARARLEDLAADIAQLRPRVEPLLVGPALRIRNDAALVLIDIEGRDTPAGPLLGLDPASGLAVVQAPFLPAPPPVPWTPADPQQARYFVAADASMGSLALQPVFIGSLVPTSTALWSDPVWLLPSSAGLSAGTFVFTTDGLLAGLVIDLDGRRAMVPGRLLLEEADRLAEPAAAPADTGISVQALTPAVARATGASSGVVVTWVDPRGPAAAVLSIGDVLEVVDGAPVTTPLDWQARARRATAGRPLSIDLRRNGEIQQVALVPAQREPADVQTLGLTLRNVPGTGSLVAEVQPGSAADRAGLRAGDVIPLAGNVRTPTPAAVRRVFDGSAADEPMLVAYTRGDTHGVTALEK